MGELRSYATFFVLEIDENVSPIAIFVLCLLRPFLHIIRFVIFSSQTQVTKSRRSHEWCAKLFAVRNAEGDVARI